MYKNCRLVFLCTSPDPCIVASVDGVFQYVSAKQSTSNHGFTMLHSPIFALSNTGLSKETSWILKKKWWFAHGEVSQEASTFWYLLFHHSLLYIMLSIQTTWGLLVDTSVSSPSWSRPKIIDRRNTKWWVVSTPWSFTWVHVYLSHPVSLTPPPSDHAVQLPGT